jgi:hypothetical protein
MEPATHRPGGAGSTYRAVAEETVVVRPFVEASQASIAEPLASWSSAPPVTKAAPPSPRSREERAVQWLRDVFEAVKLAALLIKRHPPNAVLTLEVAMASVIVQLVSSAVLLERYITPPNALLA